MEATRSELNSLLSKHSPANSRREGYSPRVKDLCIRLAKSVGVKETSQQSGISMGAIYGWIRKNLSDLSEPVSPTRKSELRPLVLQEVELPSHSPLPPLNEIMLVSTAGVVVHLPANSSTVALVLDRIMENRP